MSVNQVFMNSREYTQEELEKLHEELYGILAEIVRICDKCHIPYFILGGTAIGAFFWDGIIPWDDDIDIGLTRENYERFLMEAPKEIRKPYYLQWVGTDPHTPFYFAKIRKDNTMFVEKDFSQLDIHHGIYVDVFPFDKVPDNTTLQKVHRVVCNFFNCCFMGKDIWMWKYMRKCNIEEPHKRGLIPCFFNWLVDVCCSKKTIYNMLSKTQGMFNSCNTKYYNMVLMPRDQIRAESIEHPQQVKFGPLTVTAPSDLEPYLRHHYRNLRKEMPKGERQNHRPTFLSFDTTQQ
jgi:lipopolysaccharide cholinephosphotransferase